MQSVHVNVIAKSLVTANNREAGHMDSERASLTELRHGNYRDGDMKYLPHKPEDMGSHPQHPHKKLGTVAWVCSPRLWRWRQEDPRATGQTA